MFVVGWMLYYNIIVFPHDWKEWLGILLPYGGIWVIVFWISRQDPISKSNAKPWMIGFSIFTGILWSALVLIALFYWIGIFSLTNGLLIFIFSVSNLFSPIIVPLLIGFYFFNLNSISLTMKGKKVKEWVFGLTTLVGFLQVIIWLLFPAFDLFGFEFFTW